MTPEDIHHLSRKIDGLADQVARVDERVKGLVPPGEAPMCAVHERRMNVMEQDVKAVKSAQGKQNIIAMTLAAVASGIVLALKHWATKG